jgi:hypothetical protein
MTTERTSPRRPIWPSDDQLREQKDDQEFTDSGRKLIDAEYVGGIAPDADDTDPARLPPRPPPRDGR